MFSRALIAEQIWDSNSDKTLNTNPTSHPLNFSKCLLDMEPRHKSLSVVKCANQSIRAPDTLARIRRPMVRRHWSKYRADECAARPVPRNRGTWATRIRGQVRMALTLGYLLVPQPAAKFFAWPGHQVVLLRPSFYDSRFESVRAFWIYL
jgi:hypothetical protein